MRRKSRVTQTYRTRTRLASPPNCGMSLSCARCDSFRTRPGLGLGGNSALYLVRHATSKLLLVGYYECKKLMYVAKVRSGFTPASRASVFKRFRGLETDRCPFKNLPESHKGRWGEGLTAEDLKKCRWLKPRLIAVVEYLEWTAANHLRHSKFSETTGAGLSVEARGRRGRRGEAGAWPTRRRN